MQNAGVLTNASINYSNAQEVDGFTLSTKPNSNNSNIKLTYGIWGSQKGETIKFSIKKKQLKQQS